MFLACSSWYPSSFHKNLFSGTWAELRSLEIRKENFADVRSVGSENIVQRVLKGGSEICDELTKLVSTAVSTNQIEAFGAKTAKTLKISGIGVSWEMWLEMWRKCELWSNQQIANEGRLICSHHHGALCQVRIFWNHQNHVFKHPISGCLLNVVLWNF